MKKEIICNRANHNQDEINTVAGTVEFGRYNNGEGITPITWKVLAKDGNGLLIITEYGIDCKAYNWQ